jgi:ribosomal protein S18 acetylase RimI-like enzyme
MTPPDVTLMPAAPEDIDRLVPIRLAAMRESLERIGRWDPARAEGRFRAGWDHAHTRLILAGGELAGCVALKPRDGGAVLELEHFYLMPEAQGRGLGSAVLRLLLAEADAAARPVRLSVLVGSDAARLYQRHGFRETHRDATDIYMSRRSRVPVPVR